MVAVLLRVCPRNELKRSTQNDDQYVIELLQLTGKRIILLRLLVLLLTAATTATTAATAAATLLLLST